MKVSHLDKAIFSVVPHFFVDRDGEKLEYDSIVGGRVIALMRAGQALYFNDVSVPDSTHTILKRAYRDLQKHSHFVFEDENG